MKKQAFIHIHGLFAEITDDFENRDETINTPNYDELETRPTSVHKSKGDHKEAVMTLLNDITSSLEPEEDEVKA